MRRRLLFTYLSLLACVLVALEAPLSFTFAARETQRMFIDRVNDAARFASLAEPALRTGETVTLQAEVERYHALYGISVAVIDRDNRIVVAAGAELPLGGTVIRHRLQEALAGERPPINRVVWPWTSRPLVVSEPVGRVEVVGAVVSSSPTDQLRQRILRLWGIIWLVGLAALVVSWVLAVAMTRWILRPVRQLDDTARQITRGTLDARAAAATGPGELRHLAESFNTMADTVIGALERQRQFVDHASHQLRNPLAALRLRIENIPLHEPATPATSPQPDGAKADGAKADGVQGGGVQGGGVRSAAAQGVGAQGDGVQDHGSQDHGAQRGGVQDHGVQGVGVQGDGVQGDPAEEMGAQSAAARQTGESPDGGRLEQVRLALEETDRLTAILNGLLALARAEGSRAQAEPCEIGALVDARLNTWRPMARRQGVTLVRAGARQQAALAVPGMVEQALDELIGNACKFAGARATVTVRLERRDGMAELHVIDDGPGLEPAEREQALTRFWRSRAHQNVDGSGLGLAVLTVMAEASGGHIDLLPGQPAGLDVRLRLPLAPDPPTGAPAPADAAPSDAAPANTSPAGASSSGASPADGHAAPAAGEEVAAEEDGGAHDDTAAATTTTGQSLLSR